MKAQAALLHIARVLSETPNAREVLDLLAQASVDLTHARASGVFEIIPSGEVALVANRGLPASMATWTDDADAIGPELAQHVCEAAGDATLRHARAIPIIASGDIFGALVLGYDEPLTEADEELARGLVDLAASAMSKAAQHASLARAHEELRATQDAMLRAEKLRALGEMAAGVSHDLKNIVAPLSLHLQLAQRSLAKDKKEVAAEAVTECQAIVRRANEILERLRDFSRQAPESRVDEVDLNKLVHEAAEIAKPRMASRKGALSKIVEQLGEVPTIPARSSEVVSAIVNLTVNAIDSMASGGTITLRTGVEGSRAFVAVKDEGPGMDPDVQQKVFQPFFTTKGEKGTGLGLAMVYACMQRHGGTVTLDTAPGKGSTFTLWFPIPVA